MSDTENIQAAIDAGVALSGPQRLDSTLPYWSVAVPRDGHHALLELDVEKYALAPRRTKGTYLPATVEALTAVIERHHDPDTTTIWVHPTSGRIVVVFNDASATGSGFRDHQAVLDLTPTREWRHWTHQDGNLMSQTAFAEHIEDGLPELVSPPAADMLELAQTMQATLGAEFRSAIRLQDGSVQTMYNEDLNTSAGKAGQLTIPSTFTLAIAPFLGEQPYSVSARLRYRLNAGKLTIGYRLERPETVVRDALNTIALELAAKFPAVFLGETAAAQ